MKAALWIAGLVVFLGLLALTLHMQVIADRATPRDSQVFRFQLVRQAFCENELSCWSLPKTTDDLSKINCESCSDKNVCRWDLRYLNEARNKDSWGNPISVSNTDRGVRFLSLGADKEPGGTGQNADIEFILSCH